MTNRLAGETSPYLLQHQDNPVDWWPWGDEALAAARAQNKPILLSVGYAACHWCHVMAHESFEDPATAQVMNELFINIKVDREERPDLDAIYQQSLAMMGQQGGWPLTIFLTPAGEPFWGGTYFPPTPRYGRPGFADILRGVADTWTNAHDKVTVNVTALTSGLKQKPRNGAGVPDLTLSLLDYGARQVLPMVDLDDGGLRGAPKFPQPNLFDFLWRAALRGGDGEVAQAVTITLDHLCQGGIYDHLGGGFMRYATEPTWLVPHFEKMLYDNAQLVDLLTLVWQSTGRDLYRQRVSETVDWLLRDMLAEGGAFAATLDADSADGEGSFYVWTPAEIDAALEPATAGLFKQTYDVGRGGNWDGVSILHRNHAHGDITEAEDTLAAARSALWQVRETRSHPGRDDKILADWNGMMIAALANAGAVFDRPDWIAAARKAFDFIRTSMALPDGRLAHCLRLGRFRPIGLVDDLAHMSRAALALYEASGDESLLHQARAWVEAADRAHWDSINGGYYQSAEGANDVLVRLKPLHDYAVPSANGIMTQVLARLAGLTGDAAYTRRAEATLATFAGEINEHFTAMTSLLAGFEQLAAPLDVVVTGIPGANDTRALLAAVMATPLPTRTLFHSDGLRLFPSDHPAHGKNMVDNKAAAYVCRASVCLAPITDPAALRACLNGQISKDARP